MPILQINYGVNFLLKIWQKAKRDAKKEAESKEQSTPSAL